MAIFPGSLEFIWKILTKRLVRIELAQPTVDVGRRSRDDSETILLAAGGRHKSASVPRRSMAHTSQGKEKETPAMQNQMESEAGRISSLALQEVGSWDLCSTFGGSCIPLLQS